VEPVDISIIVVNWNSKDYVRACVASVVEQTRDIPYEIIVVDSGSFDGCAEMLAQHYPQVRFLQSKENVGFGRANNLGASIARGRCLLLLNPDTELRSNVVKDLYVTFLGLSNPGVVGCRLLNTDGSLQATCVQPFPSILNQVLNAEVLQRWFPRARLWISAAAFEGATLPQPVEVVVGACMLIWQDVFDSIQGFSKEFFMYAEDCDLCFKSQANGYINYYVPTASLIHHGGGSTKGSYSNFSNVMMRESVQRLLAKMHGETYGRVFRAASGALAVARLILLVLYAPIALLSRRSDALAARMQKWLAVLRWSVGLENWVRKYDILDNKGVS